MSSENTSRQGSASDMATTRGSYEVLDRVDVQGAQGIDFLVNSHGPQLGRHRRTDATRDEDRHHHRPQFFSERGTDQAAQHGTETSLGQQGPRLQRQHAANEEREHARHEETGVANLEQLLG